MTGTATGKQKERPDSSRDHSSDERLIGRCLKGDQEAWSALIDKYLKEVETLISSHERAGSFIEKPALELEARSLADEQGNAEAESI